jgi:hypothetical protein
VSIVQETICYGRYDKMLTNFDHRIPTEPTTFGKKACKLHGETPKSYATVMSCDFNGRLLDWVGKGA